MNHHINTPAPRPSEVMPNLPRGLDDVIARALAKNPEHRFARAGDLASAARAQLRTVPVRTSQIGPDRRPGLVTPGNFAPALRPSPGSGVRSDLARRRKSRALLAASLLALLGAVVATYFLLTNNAPPDGTGSLAPSSATANETATISASSPADEWWVAHALEL